MMKIRKYKKTVTLISATNVKQSHMY